MTDKIPYLQRTHRNYEITGPDRDGDIAVRKFGAVFYVSFDDLLMILARFDSSKTIDTEE